MDNFLLVVWDLEGAEGDVFNICARLKVWGLSAEAVNGWAAAHAGQRYWAALCTEQKHPPEIRAVPPLKHAADEAELRAVLRQIIEYCVADEGRYGTRFRCASPSAAAVIVELCEEVGKAQREAGLPAEQRNVFVPDAPAND